MTKKPADIHSILKQRAKALASEMVTLRSNTGLEVIEFLLAEERYGIESRFIQEVVPFINYTPIPGVPGFVLGIVNLRGRIISVIDLKKYFQFPEKHVGERDKLIILNDGQMEFGLQADAVIGIRLIVPEDLQSSLPTLAGIREALLMGITHDRLIILDARKLLSEKKLMIHES
jgi:purine-binding chemotaxis protein CheW